MSVSFLTQAYILKAHLSASQQPDPVVDSGLQAMNKKEKITIFVWNSSF